MEAQEERLALVVGQDAAKLVEPDPQFRALKGGFLVAISRLRTLFERQSANQPAASVPVDDDPPRDQE